MWWLPTRWLLEYIYIYIMCVILGFQLYHSRYMLTCLIFFGIENLSSCRNAILSSYWNSVLIWVIISIFESKYTPKLPTLVKKYFF